MSETCKIRAGQVKFQDRKPDWACKIVESKLKKYWAKQTRIPFFQSKQGQISRSLKSETQMGATVEDISGRLIISKFPNRPMHS